MEKNNEEYRYFKVKKRRPYYGITEPSDNNYARTYHTDSDNRKDPNEPFLNINKRKYFRSKESENIKRAVEYDQAKSEKLLDIMGIGEEQKSKILQLLHGGRRFPKPVYNKRFNRYELIIPTSMDNYQCVYIYYYIPEKDYIVISPDYAKNETIKKRFDNIDKALDWCIYMKNSSTERERELSRKVQESNKKINNLNHIKLFENFSK